jgi:hypothetical protein
MGSRGWGIGAHGSLPRINPDHGVTPTGIGIVMEEGDEEREGILFFCYDYDILGDENDFEHEADAPISPVAV